MLCLDNFFWEGDSKLDQEVYCKARQNLLDTL